MKKLVAILSLLLSSSGFGAGRIETSLSYGLDSEWLKQGNYQYFYVLLDESLGSPEEILKTFLPLDTKKLWDPKEGHFLAVAKFSYLLPLSLNDIDENWFTGEDYLQSTLPRYTLAKQGESYHVGGSLITPDFRLQLRFLKPQDPEVAAIPLLDRSQLAAGQMKATLMHQDRFGRVFFFKTAKMASALIIYTEFGEGQTLATQYILSNIINVPTKEMIRKGMVENLDDVVTGSRAAVKAHRESFK